MSIWQQTALCLAELGQRYQPAPEGEPKYVEAAFPEQRDYILDSAKTVAADCARRSGKSYGNAGRLHRIGSHFAGEMSLYVSLTKNNSRMIVGRALDELGRKYSLNLERKEIDQRLMVILPNGHHIWLAGAKNENDFEQFRGYKFAQVIIDEAQIYGPFLRRVVEDVLEPCVADLDGAIALSGTPSPAPIGFFHAVTTGLDVDEYGASIPAWSRHHWTMAENSFFRNGKGAEYREAKRIARGWRIDHPTFRREYWGEWVRDDEALAFPYDGKRNAYWELPDGKYRRVIGVDVGYTDDSCFVVLAVREGGAEIYVEKVIKYPQTIPSVLAVRLVQLIKETKPVAVVIDAAAKGYIEEFRQRHGISCYGSDKLHKMAHVQMMRGDLLSGVLKVQPSAAGLLLDEWGVLQLTEDRSKLDERYPDHASDAALYAYRYCRAHYAPELEEPQAGTPEAANAELAKHKAGLAKRIRTQQKKKFKRGY